MSREIVAVQSFKKGETVFREGEVGRTAFLVREGLVKIARQRSSSQKQTLGLAGPGQVFGEHALLSIGPRPNTAVAEQPTKCVVVHRDRLTEKLKTEDPFIAALYNILATNMRAMIDKGADLECLLQDLSEGTRALEESAAAEAPSSTQSPAPPPQKAPASSKASTTRPAQNPAPTTGPSDEDEDDAFLI